MSEAKQAEWIALTDEDRDRAFNRLDGGLTGFMKLWGWLHYAKAIEEMCREKNAPADEPMDMALCESKKLVLRVGQPYVFRPIAGCKTCEAMAAEARDAYGPDMGAPA